MTGIVQAGGVSERSRWVGRCFSGLAGALLLLDALGKLVRPEPVVRAMNELGYQQSVILPLGIVLLVCTMLYLIPRTAVLGAILLTGYLGGAVATHARVGHPLVSHTLFPMYFGAMVWLGLYLRGFAPPRGIAPPRGLAGGAARLG